MPRQSAATRSSLHSPSRTASASRNHHTRPQPGSNDPAFHMEHPGGRRIAAAMPLSSPLSQSPLHPSPRLSTWSPAPFLEVPTDMRAPRGGLEGGEVLNGHWMSASDGGLTMASSSVIGHRIAPQEARLAPKIAIQHQNAATSVRVDR